MPGAKVDKIEENRSGFMKQEQLRSHIGYGIPCVNQILDGKKNLIVLHGFGSSKDSPMVQALRDEMPKHGIGTYSFDFPSHGESSVDGDFLRIPHCIEDLRVVSDHVKGLQSADGETYYFASSFGAYVLLAFLESYPHRHTKSFLRSAAVKMNDIFCDWLRVDPPVWTTASCGDSSSDFFVMDYDYAREMKITRAFLEDLKNYNPFSYSAAHVGSIRMIHGQQDNVASPEAATAFARQFGADLKMLPCGEHRLMGYGEMEAVLNYALDFFL